MPALIHLNGPGCVGKSTIAAALAAERPLALNLDIDLIRVSLGGWETDPESKRVARARGFEMAARHLADGYDVVMPQLIMRADVIDLLASLASDAGAEMIELALVASIDELVGRIVPTPGGHPRDEFSVDELRQQMEYCLRALPNLVKERPFARIVNVSSLLPSQALEAVRTALEDF